jgi:putative metalloprotease
MNRRNAIATLPGLVIVATYPDIAGAGIDLGGALGAATDAAKAATLSDDEVRKYAAQMAAYSDRQAKIAPAGSPYATRLSALTSGLTEDAGIKLNFKCYVTKQVNAFAMADGTIRLYSGLMDMMTDDELRYVVGHEMGHIKNGHTRKRMQAALAASATQKGVAASGTTCATPIASIDYFPTLLEAADKSFPKQKSIDGVSIVPLLRGESLEERKLYWDYPHYGNQGGSPASAVRDGKWKLIEWREDAALALYDLEADPSETHNLAKTQAKIASRMQESLAKWRQQVGAKSPTKNPKYRSVPL